MMNEIDLEQWQEDGGYGEFLMGTIAEGFCGLPYDAPEHRINKAIYKGTSCGAWVKFDEEGIMVGTIVEGSDAEHSERIDLTGIGLENGDILIQRFSDALERCENFADEVWADIEWEDKWGNSD